MSKYTTELRYICMNFSELDETSSINDILDKSWNKIFTKNWSIFDESYRKDLCIKILRTFYTREICAETVGLWQLWLDATMCEIMPKYNKLYESETFKYNPLYNVDITTTYERKADEVGTGYTDYSDKGSQSLNGSTKTSNSSNQTDGYSSSDRYSDTPQGGLTDIENNKYLTNVRLIEHDDIINKEDSGNATNQSSGTKENSGTTENNTAKSNTENWIEKVTGKNNGENYSKTIQDFRDAIINIDQMIINDLKPLFFNLW